jgi:hypothetical protein
VVGQTVEGPPPHQFYYPIKSNEVQKPLEDEGLFFYCLFWYLVVHCEGISALIAQVAQPCCHERE